MAPTPVISPELRPNKPQLPARELIAQKPSVKTRLLFLEIYSYFLIQISSFGGFAAFAGSKSSFSAVAHPSRHPVQAGRPIWSPSISDSMANQNKSDESVIENAFKLVSQANTGNVLEEGKVDASIPTAKHTRQYQLSYTAL